MQQYLFHLLKLKKKKKMCNYHLCCVVLKLLLNMICMFVNMVLFRHYGAPFTQTNLNIHELLYLSYTFGHLTWLRYRCALTYTPKFVTNERKITNHIFFFVISTQNQ